MSAKNRIRISRPRKAIDKPFAKRESPLDMSSANLMYAGYPYDPYA
jgi:hypothetical protein